MLKKVEEYTNLRKLHLNSSILSLIVKNMFIKLTETDNLELGWGHSLFPIDKLDFYIENVYCQELTHIFMLSE